MRLVQEQYCPNCGTRSVVESNIKVYRRTTPSCACSTTLVVSDTLFNVPETLPAHLDLQEVMLRTPEPTPWYPWGSNTFRRSRRAEASLASLPLTPKPFALDVPDAALPDLMAFHARYTDDPDWASSRLNLELVTMLFPFAHNAHEGHSDSLMVTESGAQWQGKSIGSHRLLTATSPPTALDPASCILSVVEGVVRPHTRASLLALRIVSTYPLPIELAPLHLYPHLWQAQAAWDFVQGSVTKTA
ncbi:hypothetical protein A1Q2_05714 [Trichosporon asahii var. asahii CBS 8904]|uniref:Uncharacterized protein n=1 Tax=Trichosporon asahii var. asahii (strain CBS 8904) TaxID=1220162 RepID=K1V7L6_TRIAC|nr:hypothetical protein A1Q2_05714 [Trichosporon asahii var. asahii CBS 8904]